MKPLHCATAQLKDPLIDELRATPNKPVIVHTAESGCAYCPMSLLCMQVRPFQKEKTPSSTITVTADEQPDKLNVSLIGTVKFLYCAGCHTLAIVTAKDIHVCGLLRLGSFSRLKLLYGLPASHMFAALGNGGWEQKTQFACNDLYKDVWDLQQQEEDGKHYQENLKTDDIRELLRKSVAVECVQRVRAFLLTERGQETGDPRDEKAETQA